VSLINSINTLFVLLFAVSHATLIIVNNHRIYLTETTECERFVVYTCRSLSRCMPNCCGNYRQNFQCAVNTFTFDIKYLHAL